MERRCQLLLGLFLAVVVGGCQPGVSGSPATGSPGPADPGAIERLAYSCGRFPFGPEFLSLPPGHAEQDATPVAAALRAHLGRDEIDVDFLPDTGWTLAGLDVQGAEYIARDPGDGDDPPLVSVTLENRAGAWKVTGWGQCQPRIVIPAGVNQATWVFDLDKPLPDRTTRMFEALVTERECASGQPSEGRILDPQIIEADAIVLVIFTVRPLPGNAFDCPGNPATRVTVDLGFELGDRKLMDGGQLPFGDPADCERQHILCNAP